MCFLYWQFKELGHHVTYHANKLGGNLKSVGTAILNSALEQGKNLLVNGAQGKHYIYVKHTAAITIDKIVHFYVKW